LALGTLLLLAVATGILANAVGTDWLVDPIAVHAAVAIAVLLLAPWKSVIVRRGLARRRRHRWVSLALLGLVATALTSGLLHATGLTDRAGPLTLMQVHVGAGLLAPLLLAAHWRLHPVKPRAVDLDRRALLNAATLGVAATGAWWLWESSLAVAGVPGADRRFTGSVEKSSGRPAGMPVYAWLDDRTQHLDPARWSLQVADLRLSAAELTALSREEVSATLDCTGGWFSTQRWTGIRLDRLLLAAGVIEAGTGTEPLGEAGWRSVVVTSVTGYARWFPLDDLTRIWVATSVGGQPLSPGHGYPARIVAPDRRAFWWVKWVDSIRPARRPAWAQLPFPPT
jgi:DMSO/TMAO reductase YedYZ molybdopterin-dependent catalytic subunit